MATCNVNLTNMILGKKYRLLKSIGYGSFGHIYLAECIATGEEVAVKLEDKKIEHPQLVFEGRVYEVLSGVMGIPKVIAKGDISNYNYLVMDLLGPSLENLFNFCDRTFTLKTVLMLGHQMISRIEHVHSRGFVHRDMKPENFLMGLGRQCNTLFLIDYGLAKKYKDKSTRRHIAFRKGKRLTGTARYASINNHNGCELSRRDDLESIGYILIYFLQGSLPWQGFKDPKKKKYEKIKVKKINTPVSKLCKNLPSQLATYINYCRELQFDQQPDYSHLKDLLKHAFLSNNFQCDWVYDWTNKKEGRLGV